LWMAEDSGAAEEEAKADGSWAGFFRRLFTACGPNNDELLQMKLESPAPVQSPTTITHELRYYFRGVW